MYNFSTKSPKVFQPTFDKMFEMKEEGGYEIEEFEE